jgi:ATPase subunit of ABC transporter with duplicated ATPase domains
LTYLTSTKFAVKKRQDQASDYRDVAEFKDKNKGGQSKNVRQQMSTMVDDMEFCQRDIDNKLAAQYSPDEKLFAEVTLNIALDQGIFEDKHGTINWKELASPATNDQMLEFKTLEMLVKAVTKDRLVADKRTKIMPNYDMSQTLSSFDRREDQSLANGEIELEMPDLVLNIEHSRAHDIVMNHLKAHLEGRCPRQTLMTVIGPGGTGKSTLLNALTTTFGKLKVPQLLAKTAMTGVAASLIGGTTLHWFPGLPVRQTPQSDIWPDDPAKYIRDCRAKNLKPPLWLAIDEVSMCTLDLLTLLSQVTGQSKSQ